MKIKILIILILLLSPVLSSYTGATNYWVSPTGDDDNSGLDSTEAWVSIDRGAQISILAPGDTIHILPGTYTPTREFQLKAEGSLGQPIVYKRFGTGAVIVDASGSSDFVFKIDKNYIILDGLEIHSGSKNAIELTSDSCTIQNLYIHDVEEIGINVKGKDNVLLRNVIAHAGKDAITVDNEFNKSLHNTIYYPYDHGIHYKAGVIKGRVFNNIVVGAEVGIRGRYTVTCGFNLLWFNEANYTAGIYDSAGGILANPLFFDTAAGNFNLQSSSPCINSGMDIGYVFSGSAPDRGAIEYSEVDILTITPALDTLSADTTYQFTAEGYDNFGNVVNPGDLTWSHTFSSGTINASGLFTPQLVGDGKIIAVIDTSGLADTTATITVIPGNLVSLEVDPSSDAVEALHSLQFSATGYDSDGNNYGNLTDSATWSTTDAGGSITATGLYTAGAGLGNKLVIATYGIFADTAHIVVIPSGSLDYLRIEYEDGTPVADTSLATDIDTTEFYCRAYETGDILIGDVVVQWQLLGVDSIGSLTKDNAKSTVLILDRPGTGRVAVAHVGGEVDTTGTITCTGGLPQRFSITPDTATITADSTLQFAAVSVDNDNNPSMPQILPVFSLFGGIGNIDASGLFTPETAGTGHVVVTGGGLCDTTGEITVNPGILAQIIISPDTITVGLNDTVQYSLAGYDAKMNETDPGTITWDALGRSGVIDNDGLFISSSIGRARITALSSFKFLVDTSGFVDVEEILVSSIPLGNSTVSPGYDSAAVLAFHIHNWFDDARALSGLTIRDNSEGYGSFAERLKNVDSVGLYYDKDNDSLFNAADSLVAIVEYAAAVQAFVFDPIAISAGEGLNFFVAQKLALNARDGDTLDVYLFPAADITFQDATVPAGPANLNSLGKSVINGLVVAQLNIVSTGTDTIITADTLYTVMALDIPRNGYQVDTLTGITFVNRGTADSEDIDSLVLFADDGDDIWEGPAVEYRVGRLIYTGGNWSLSGLVVALNELYTRFFIAAELSEYPTNGATIALELPRDGITVSSGNDGPIDLPLIPVDTVVIRSTERLYLSGSTLTSTELIPGEQSPPVVFFNFQNSYADAVMFDSLLVTSLATDPGGAALQELDSQFDSLALYLKKDLNNNGITSADSLMTTAGLSAGKALFDIGGFSLSAGGGSARLAITSFLNLENSKDGNTVNFAINNAAAVFTQIPRDIEAVFPVKNSFNFSLNAFPASAVGIAPFEGKTIFGDQTDQIGLDFTLPSRGYSPDILNRIRIVNTGTLNDAEALTAVKLWKDKSGNGWTPDDKYLGAFTRKSTYWELEGLSQSISTFGERFSIAFSVKNESFEGGTLLFNIPLEGIIYASGMTGPDDSPVANPSAHLVFPSNRVTIISIPMGSETIRPASAENRLLTFALYNGYTDRIHHLKSLTLSNISHTSSDLQFADSELNQISLYFDSDKNRLLNGDPLIGSGHFSDGQLQITGLDIALPAESLSYFFVVTDLSTSLIDSDSLALSIPDPSSFEFLESANINGDIPVTSGGYLIIDGSIAEQYDIIPVLPRTLSPGDTSVFIFGFRPAANGNLIDTLISIELRNRGNASVSDISNLYLWQDANDDETWQDGDTPLGSLNYISGAWQSDDLELEIGPAVPSLFILCDVSAAATPDATVQFVIPVNGCRYDSDNDGPIDTALANPGELTISNSGLRVAYTLDQQTYSVGQDIIVGLNVTNILAAPVDNIIADVLTIDNPSLVQSDSALAGPITLEAGESAQFKFYYTSLDTGLTSWRLHAVAQLINDTSAAITTESIQIQAVPANPMARLINSIPTSATRGQLNIFPLSLEIFHPSTNSAVAPIELDSLRINVRDGTGNPVFASSVFSRMVLSSGYTNLSIIETLPDQESVLLQFASPLLVFPGQRKVISLLVDIDSLAQADEFALAIATSAALPVVDKNTGLLLPYDASVIFPLYTAVCGIHDPAEIMAVSCVSLLGNTANFGQEDVEVISLNLLHPGLLTSSPIQLSQLSFNFVDSLNTPLIAAELAERVRLYRGDNALASFTDFPEASTLVDIPFNSPLVINPGENVEIILAVSLKTISPYTNFGIYIADSTAFTVRDLSSGSLLTAATDTSVLSTGSVFPISTGRAILNNAALPCRICINSTLPSSIVGGVDSLSLAALEIAYPYSDDYSAVILRQIAISLTDSLGQPLNPDLVFDGIGYRVDSGPLSYQTYVTILNGKAIFEITGGLAINPNDVYDLTLVGDIETDIPYDNFRISISGTDALVITDQTDTSHSPGFTLSDDCPESLPFYSDLTSVFLPAGRPLISGLTGNVGLAYPGQVGASFIDGEISYTSLTPKGDLSLTGLFGKIHRRGPEGLIPAQAAQVFDSIYLLIDNQKIAGTGQFDGDSLILILDSAFIIRSGEQYDFSLKCDLRGDAPSANYLISFEDSTFLEVSDKNLETPITVLVESGSYPLATKQLAVAAASLKDSFTGYPNPFNASRGQTAIIGYVLPEDALVDIEIFAITGEGVSSIAKAAFRAAGSHQEDQWAGLNDLGLEVVPGTYFCRITAKFISGRTESYRRKISLIR